MSATLPIEHRRPVSRSAKRARRSPLSIAGLGVFFFLATHAPRLVERLKPLFVRLAYALCPAVRRATAANAAALGIQDHRRYALTVLSRFYGVVIDIVRSGFMTRDNLLQQVALIDGHDAFRASRAAGGGAIILTAHAGSFEVGLAALSKYEPHIHVVFKRDPFSQFERSRHRLRQLLGVFEAPVDEGPTIWMGLRDALRQDHVVALQGDRTPPGQKGMAAPVRGGTLLLPTGPFKLALATGAPVVPIFSARTAAGKVELYIKPAIRVCDGPDGVAAGVMAYARELDTFLAEHSDQWLVLEPAFCDNSRPN